MSAAKKSIDPKKEKFNDDVADLFDHSNPVPGYVDQLKKWVGKKNKILDVACGGGYYGAIFIESGNEVHGIEISKTLVQKSLEKKIKAIQADVEEPFPYPDKTFDKVLTIDILEHLFFPGSTLQEVHRVLKKNGEIIVNVPNASSWFLRFLMLFGRLQFTGQGKDLPAWKEPHIRFYTLKTLSDMLRAHGFEVVESRSVFVGFPGMFGSITPFPINKGFFLLNRITGGLDFLGNIRPSLLSSNLLVRARKK